jgi:hypothetical protein
MGIAEGQIRITVDGKSTLTPIHLPQGISPDRFHQPFVRSNQRNPW